MSVHTILLDFTTDPAQLKNAAQITLISTNIENILRDYLTNLKEISRSNLDESVLKVYTCDFGALVTLRFYQNGLITVNIEYYKDEGKEPLFPYEKVKRLEQSVSERVNGVRKSRALVPLHRSVFPVYFPTSDERLIEYDIDKIVFEEKTSFQKVQILHSKSLGNMLVLDDLQNISERDVIYTDTIMNKPVENYKDKEIVILGGGDGALLHELLKENPKEVIMLEIDEVVMKACSKYMRSLCGDVLDKKSGPNYKIIVTDCLVALDEYIKEGRTFDYVFGDLTDVPISDDPELWSFMEKVLQKVMKVMKPGSGKLMTQICGAICKDALLKYENLLAKQKPTVEIRKTTAFIPSFMEDWVFGFVNFA